MPVSKASNHNPENIACDSPPETHDTLMDPMGVDPSSAKLPSPTKPAEVDTEDVLVTGTGYVEPRNPIVLAKHSAKEELLASQKIKTQFDTTSYSNLGVNELYSGYMSYLHTGCDMEANLVKRMQQKYEV